MQCCKFAEGDSRILMLKMARDGFSRWRKKGAAPSEVRRSPPSAQEAIALIRLVAEWHVQCGTVPPPAYCTHAADATTPPGIDIENSASMLSRNVDWILHIAYRPHAG